MLKLEKIYVTIERLDLEKLVRYMLNSKLFVSSATDAREDKTEQLHFNKWGLVQLQRTYKLQPFVHNLLKRNSVSCEQSFVRPTNQNQMKTRRQINMIQQNGTRVRRVIAEPIKTPEIRFAFNLPVFVSG